MVYAYICMHVAVANMYNMYVAATIILIHITCVVYTVYGQPMYAVRYAWAQHYQILLLQL